MKRILVILVPALLLLFIAGYFWMRQQKQKLEARMRADIQKLEQQMKAKADSIPVDLHELHAGDTALVAACTKSFFISSDGITGIQPDPSIDKDYISIAHADESKYELKFSCESVKNALGIYPFVFTTTQGRDITIYFMPMPDLNGQLKFYSNFTIR